MAETKPTPQTPVKAPETKGPNAAPKPVGAPEAPFNFDALVANAEVIEGFDLVDKAELRGVEFVITGVRFDAGARNVGYVYVDGVNRAGDKFTFNDSSGTGIKSQIIDLLNSKGIEVSYESGEVIELQVHVPKGVRVSEYIITDVKGKERNARTYYLTTSGSN